VLDRAASPVRLQAALMIGVVASFLVASAMAAARGSAIDADVDAIIGGAMPSVQHLSSARGHLHDLDTSLAEYVLAADDGRSISGRGVGAARHALEASLSRGVRLGRSGRAARCSEAASSLASAHGPSGRRAKGALPHQGHFHLSR